MKGTRSSWLSICLLLLPLAAFADFVPDDQIISDPTKDLPQPEFDSVGVRMIWQDRFNQLWVADVDPDTGDIDPIDGKGLLIDSGLAPVGEVGNTPRFTYGAGESVLVYTKKVSNVLHLASAREQTPGVWLPELLQNGDKRWRANGTPEDNPDAPRIVYNMETPQGDTVVAWRDVDDPATEGMAQVLAQGGRFLGTERAILALNKIGGVTHVMEIDIDTGLGEQITFGPINKLNAFIWWAPEYQDLAFVVMNNFTSLGIYTRVNGVWNQVHSFAIPSAKPLLSSPEAFVSNGKSYISVVTADELGAGAFPGQPVGPSEIWIAGIDPDAPFFRRLDDPSYAAQRSEPEPFMLASGPIIYHTELDDATGARLLKRAATGLGADYGYDNTAYGGAWAAMHRDASNCACTPFEIADQYTEAYRTLLPNFHFTRGTLGPEGNLYMTISDTNQRFLVAVDTDTGAERYRIPEALTTTKLSATNALIDARAQLYVTANEAASKFSSDGELIWQVPTRGLARSPQFAPDGKLLFFSWNGWAYVLDPADGTVLLERNLLPWRPFPAQPACLSGGAPSSCAYINAPAVDRAAGVVYNTGIRRDGQSMIQAFTYQTSPHDLINIWQGASPVVPGVATSPVLSPDRSRLYVQDGAGNLVAVNTASGTVAWSFPLGFVSDAPPVVSQNGYILPGGTRDGSPGYDFVGVIEDLGGSAQWVFKDSGYVPASSAAAGAGDRFVLAGRLAGTNTLRLLVLEPQGVLSATNWGAGAPNTLKGLTLREDGWVFVQTWGQFGVKAFEPLP